MLQARRLQVLDPTRRMNFVNLPNLSALGFTQLLTEMSTRSRKIMLIGSKAWPVCRTDNLTAICEPTV
jgi:hypothetical protein